MVPDYYRLRGGTPAHYAIPNSRVVPLPTIGVSNSGERVPSTLSYRW